MAVTATKTVRDVCTIGLRRVGVVAKGLPAPAEDMSVAVNTLDSMLKGWQLDGIRRFTRTTGSITVTNATASYAIATRPLSIQSVRWKDADGVETRLVQMLGQEYDELPDKDGTGRATTWFYDLQATTGTLHVWPVLATATTETLEWTGQREVEDITSASDTVDAPSEHWSAIEWNLSLELMADYPVKDPVRAQTIRDIAPLKYNEMMGGSREDFVEIEVGDEGYLYS